MIRKDAETGAPFGHNGIRDLIRFFQRFTRRIIIMHYGTWFFRDIQRSRHEIESLGDGVRVVAAYDGLEIHSEAR